MVRAIRQNRWGRDGGTGGRVRRRPEGRRGRIRAAVADLPARVAALPAGGGRRGGRGRGLRDVASGGPRPVRVPGRAGGVPGLAVPRGPAPRDRRSTMGTPPARGTRRPR